MVKKFMAGIIGISLILSLAGCGKPKVAQVASTKQQAAVQSASQQNENTNFKSSVDNMFANIAYKPTKFEAKNTPYSVKPDLSNVENLSQFGIFTAAQRNLLSRNSFVVVPTKEEQLFFIYENNEYLKIPSFISVDSVLEVNHLFFDYSLRKIEENSLMSAAIKLNDNMLDDSISQYNKINNLVVKQAALKNIAFFAVTQKILGESLPKGIPIEASKLAAQEFNLITKQVGYSDSFIFPYKIDYSQFTPRGHYVKSEGLKTYFKVMTWYGQVPFPIEKSTSSRTYKNQLLQAMLMTNELFSNKESVDLWNKIYIPTSIYVGKSDDINLYDLNDILTKVYGSQLNYDALDDKAKMDLFYQEADKLPEPRIQAKVRNMNIQAGKQFRFMGQRYILDSEILQNLVDLDKRPVPKSLDVMAVLGSDRAYNILMNNYHENKNWDKYTSNFNSLKTKFSAMTDDQWKSNMYTGWLWTLKSLLHPFGFGYPSFMTNQAWKDKSLDTALGSWSELRHDTMLYAKQSNVAECGGGDVPPQIKGYVEPNIELYDKLIWLSQYAKENAKQRGVLTPELEDKMNSYDDILQFLLKCSVKELNNQELTQEEYDQIRIYGGQLESLTTYLKDAEKWYLVTGPEKEIAVVADVHTYQGPEGVTYLEEATGLANEIYVVVPIGGKLYLTRGAVFSYYEFQNNKRLTDQQWQQMLNDGKAPKVPDWTKSYLDEQGKHDVPQPVQTFSSGC
jgi:hypothetical protein